MNSHLIAPYVQAFFADYLCQQRRLSPQTILSSRDTFRLLLTFLRDQTGVEPSAVRIADVDAELVRLYERDAADPNRQTQLWRTRVELLENLQAVQRAQALRPAVF